MLEDDESRNRIRRDYIDQQVSVPVSQCVWLRQRLKWLGPPPLGKSLREA